MSDHPCSICKGACCESLLFPMPWDASQREFLLARGTQFSDSLVEVESKCQHLTSCGSCGIHANRPKVCREYEVGGILCLATINARRDPETRHRIVDAISKL